MPFSATQILGAIVVAAALLWMACLAFVTSPTPEDPNGLVTPVEAMRLAKEVEIANDLGVRSELTKAIADDKLTWAELRRVEQMIHGLTQKRMDAQAKAALGSAAKGYSE